MVYSLAGANVQLYLGGVDKISVVLVYREGREEVNELPVDYSLMPRTRATVPGATDASHSSFEQRRLKPD